MFKGSFTALVTPFHENGSVNFEKLRKLVEWQISEGIDGIVALGTTGESSTMSHEEDDAVAEAVID
ncbi:MAG: dihydrodipicolinate synthase family protein, partial [Clostridia bacterium]|nr:dihydrodipicolinate synthase family protein [Clostridia bacterium]